MPGPLARDLAEARRYLGPDAAPEALRAFAARQLGSRLRFTQLRAFYGAHPCRMARIHLLTASAVTIGRFCGFSALFAAIGEAVQPVDADCRPRTAAWAEYAESCRAGRPWEVRDELWIAAHVADMQDVRSSGLDLAFEHEAAAHAGDPTWRLLRQHMEMTLGARLSDHGALAGRYPFETAIAQGISTSLGRLARGGFGLLGRYARETSRALLSASPEPVRQPPLASERATAIAVVRYACTAWTAAGVWRRGVRGRTRGLLREGDAWELLAEALGERTRELHPLVVRFYSNPANFTVRAELELHTLPARLLSFAATLLIGQGLYEADPEPFDARFRVFRRDDGSMHFVRELYPRGARRVFDSDFVVREVDGVKRFFEHFDDHGIDVEMDLLPLPGGGLSIRGRRVFVRGVRMPEVGLKVEFRSRVVETDRGGEELRIDGELRMQPGSRLGRFLVRDVLGRPEHLGAIHYRIRERT